MRKDGLRLTLWTDDDGTADLGVEARANGFGGRSSAWFTVEELEAFARELDRYPLSADPAPLLEGGYWGNGQLRETHVSLSVRPVNRRGGLMVLAILATPGDEGIGPGMHATVRVPCDYSSLQRFSREMLRLVAGEVPEAILDARLP